MADIRALNQSGGPAPFWDFVASINQRDGPWAGAWAEGPSHHHGRSGHRHGGEHGEEHGHRHERREDHEHNDEKEQDDEREQGASDEDQPMTGDAPNEGPGGPFPPHMHRGRSHRGPHGGPHGGVRGGFRGSRGREHGCGGRREGFGMRRGPGPFGMPFEIPPWLANGAPWGPRGMNQQQGQPQDFKPSVDIFDTPNSYIVHASLPGAAKSDIGVSWDPEKSVLIISGVVHRPGDEEFLKTLAMGERQVGAFERKVYLGTANQPAHVDEDSISAKLEDGILRVEVPKIQKEEGYVTVRKVDIQ